MQTLDLQTAISHIVQVVRESDKPPFFFVVGAGISEPFVPLAPAIESHCRKEAAGHGRVDAPPSNKPIDTYSHWFSRAFPQADQRQAFLRKLIEDRPISPANLRLAHLLIKNSVTNLVVTPNFDDFLSRALTIFGRRHILCDHPRTVDRVDAERDDTQIVHVHGTYPFYDCCNLKAEIEGRAQQLPDTILSMLALLDNILAHRSPIVIGYGGWEGDVIMTALKRRVCSGSALRCNVYWFCYSEDQIDQLPEWLKDNPHVCVVAPPKPAEPARGDTGERTQEGTTEPLGIARPASAIPTAAASKRGATDVLPARKVLDELIKSLGLEAPELTSDPLGFFVNHVERQLGTGDAEDDVQDIYLIGNVVRRLKRAKDLEADLSAADAQIEAIRDALRRSEYREAIQQAGELEHTALAEEQLQDLAQSALAAAIGLFDNSAEELRGYDLVGIFARAAMAKQREEPPSLAILESRALNLKGLTLRLLQRNEEAVATWGEVVQRFSGTPEPKLQQLVASAFVNSSVSLSLLQRDDEAIAACDDMVRRFGDVVEPEVQPYVARALVNKGLSLDNLKRHREAAAVYDEVVRRFGNATELELRKQVAWALMRKGDSLSSLGYRRKATASYDEVVLRFGDAAEPELQERVAAALMAKGFSLNSRRDQGKAIAAFDEVIRRFGDASEVDLLEQVALALIAKASVWGLRNRPKEAAAACAEVVRRFGDAPQAELQRVVKMAKASLSVSEPGSALDTPGGSE